MDESAYSHDKAKQYQRIKQRVALFHLAWTPFLLACIAFTPVTDFFSDAAGAVSGNRFIILSLYFILMSLMFLIVDLPLSFYSGYILEHRYQLSNQNLRGWLSFSVKRSLLSFALSLFLILVLYALIWNFPERWWIWAWALFALFSYVMGKIFPVWIVPLFYRYDRVQDGDLRKRIFALTDRYGLPVENLYSLNLSKTTRKANAAFMGIGKTRRVVLSDTLVENFTPEEIETVVAHELGHFKHRDILKQLIFGMAGSFAGFWLGARILENLSRLRRFEGAGDVAGLPLLFLVFYVLGLVWTPIQSAFSRRMERAADRFALEACRQVGVFISCMEKLARVNLADPDPHPVYEWFFYDHPAISRRIAMAKEWERNSK